MKSRGKYRTTILMMLLLATVINYIDRSALSIAMPFITGQLWPDHAAIWAKR